MENHLYRLYPKLLDLSANSLINTHNFLSIDYKILNINNIEVENNIKTYNLTEDNIEYLLHEKIENNELIRYRIKNDMKIIELFIFTKKELITKYKSKLNYHKKEIVDNQKIIKEVKSKIKELINAKM